jgi:hypothetical protein
VLIVCEGKKTEPNYLGELVSHFKLSTANIFITGDCGSAPSSVVDKAIELFERDPSYDKVYCVIDRDGHADFHAAIDRIKNKRLVKMKNGEEIGIAAFEPIRSIPCFEYWILLHYQYTTAPLNRFSDVAKLLRRIPALKSYDKGAVGLFQKTFDELSTATKHAVRSRAAAKQTNTDNPTTEFDVLVGYLIKLSKK